MAFLYIILLLSVLFGILFGLEWLIKTVWKFAAGTSDSRYRKSSIPMNHIEYMLHSRFAYYRSLPQEQKARFIQRLITYMESKEFSTRKGLVLTDEMRVLISASAVQVTFGLDKYLMDNFPRIIIYPEKYLSKVTGEYHKGEVNLAGIIALSWHDFVEGYKIGDNSRNLGLHEMAHAVRFDKFRGDYDEFFYAYFHKWTRAANAEFTKIRDTDEESIFREYAGSNIHEFFAVCVENFFEAPLQFKAELPELYEHTCILLNQDPSQPFRPDVRNEKLAIGKVMEKRSVVISTIYQPFWWLGFFLLLIPFVTSYDPYHMLESILRLCIYCCAGILIANHFTRRMLFYTDGMEIRSFLRTPFTTNREIDFLNILSAEMREHEMLNQDGHTTYSYDIEIFYHHSGKVYSYVYGGSIDEIKAIGMMLHEKTVAVKVFDQSLKWN